jgi:hypothetical protein
MLFNGSGHRGQNHAVPVLRPPADGRQFVRKADELMAEIKTGRWSSNGSGRDTPCRRRQSSKARRYPTRPAGAPSRQCRAGGGMTCSSRSRT